MEKTFPIIFRWSLSLILVSVISALSAQNASISGTIADDSGEALPGASVILEGTSTGTVSDLDGKYNLTGIPAGTYNVAFSFVGHRKSVEKITLTEGQSVIVNKVLSDDILLLEAAVVVGYGTTTAKDLTGAVTSVGKEDFQRGAVATPEQLISGKVAGVKINSNSGMPGAGSRIRIRGGTSLNASNDPLIVIDGVPVDNGGISGSGNALSLINPDDIENITVLKDASSAAIYGARGANGVVLITTKSGSDGEFQLDFTTNNSVSINPGTLEVMTGDQYRALLMENGTATQQALLGTENTIWQDQIYTAGISSDNNLAFSGGIDNLPYRIGLEYSHIEGVLKTSSLDRTGISLNLNPTFLDDDLTVTVNGKYYYTRNQFADQGAIGSAVRFDPTQPVFSGDTAFGGYFEWIDPATGNPNVLAGKNPLGLLEQREDKSNVHRFIGNIQLDYKLPFLRELSANLNAGTDIARSNGGVFIPAEAAASFVQGGVSSMYEQEKDNRLLEFYLNYDEQFGENGIDLTAGYSYQTWETFSPSFPNTNAAGDTITPPDTIPFITDNTLIGFFGRLNYNLKEKYLLTANLRYDGSSRFSPETRWGLFPSLSVAWRITEENFLRSQDVVSNLKLRAGWGITGQQDVFNDYPYIANFSQGTPTAQYQFGDVFYTVFRPDGYDPNIKWEETTTYNIGLDFGFNNNKISGTLDLYLKDTEDLLAVVPVPAGTNFTNQILTNVGSMQNRGAELSLNYIAIDDGDLYLDLGINGTINKNEIKQLALVQDPDDPGILVGGIAGGIGNTVQIHSVGSPAFTYYLYEQMYEGDQAVEGEYVDQNGDGMINEEDLVLFDGNPEPSIFLGFNASMQYKKFSAGFTMRSEIGHYIYNNVKSDGSTFQNAGGTTGSLSNLVTSYYEEEFTTAQFLSDLYLEDASYLRMDNFYASYNFGQLGGKVGLVLGVVVQNVFVVSGYSGLDPEINGGIDNNIFPRPRVFQLNLNLKM